MTELTYTLPTIAITVFLISIGIFCGIVAMMLVDWRMRKRIIELRGIIAEVKAIEILERDNNRLKTDNVKLQADVLRQRKAMTFAASLTGKMKTLQYQNKQLRKDLDKQTLHEEARYGALVKFLTMNGFTLTKEQWSKITPSN